MTRNKTSDFFFTVTFVCIMVFLVRLLGFPSISTSSICVEDAQDVEAITEELQKKTVSVRQFKLLQGHCVS